MFAKRKLVVNSNIFKSDRYLLKNSINKNCDKLRFLFKDAGNHSIQLG